MSRTVKYILTIALIIAGAMFLMAVYRSCENNKKNNTEISANNNGTDRNTDDGLEDLYEEEDDETLGGETEDSTATNTEGTSIDPAEENGTTENELKEVENKDDIIGNGINDNGGEYLVVAGAFISKSNAKLLQKQLAKKGYDSEIRVFLGSDYHSVIIGNYPTERSARGIAKKIGGEAYVHKKRYPKKKR